MPYFSLYLDLKWREKKKGTRWRRKREPDTEIPLEILSLLEKSLSVTDYSPMAQIKVSSKVASELAMQPLALHGVFPLLRQVP